MTEVLDESRPAYDLEELEKKYSGTLIGDYISYFLEKDRSAMEEKCIILWTSGFAGDEQVTGKYDYQTIEYQKFWKNP